MNPTPSRWRLALLSAAAAALLASCGGGNEESAEAPSAAPQAAAAPMAAEAKAATAAAAMRQRASNRIYLVQMADAPASSYRGNIRGYAPTRLARGQKLNPNSQSVASYLGYLHARHDAVLGSVGNPRKVYSYGYVFNGFAAELSDEQVLKLKATKGVVAVTKDHLRHLDTVSTPTFIGLTGDTGYWQTAGAKGENVIIGMVDSGFTPFHLSFSDHVDSNGFPASRGTLAYGPPPGWSGAACKKGDGVGPIACNNKVIGARHYNSGWGGNAGISATFPFEFNSPRDWGGHGTHTASTAGGNEGVQITGPAAPLGRISGMAPRARLAIYKVCWATEATGGGCFNSDSVAAIEQAIADGVDVINFSIGGSLDSSTDPVEMAFLEAASSGVFVAVSAGNSGPDNLPQDQAPVEHPSPWVMTVAAGTHSRTSVGTVSLANSTSHTGSSLNDKVVKSSPFVDGSTIAMKGQGDAARLCFSKEWNGKPALDPAKVKGKVVLCDRGTNDRVDKSLAVKEAGGIGMVLVNVTPNNLVPDIHSVPTVHLPDTLRATLKAYAATAGAKAAIAKSTSDFSTPAPSIAGFSSRGPSLAAGGSILKPDIMAPGVDVMAAVAPAGNGGNTFASFQGTSMASPHIAGIAALFKQARPTWSPMMIKSALMTTAYDTIQGNATNTAITFGQGAGHVNPKLALDPGLVFDSNVYDWYGYLCGTELGKAFCDQYSIPTIDPSDMNVASIAVGGLAGSQTVTRRVKNVGAAGTYTASFSGSGMTVAMDPPSLVIAANATATVTFTLTKQTAGLNAWTGGLLTLTDGTHNVRMPVVAQPVALGVPAQATGTYQVKFGYDGSFSATARGLIPAAKSPTNVALNGCRDITVTVPPGTTYARFSTFDSDVNASGTDVDMYVFKGSAPACPNDGGGGSGYVGGSGSGTAEEEVNLSNPTSGTYVVRVTGFAMAGSSVAFNLHTWLLGTSDAGNMGLSAPGSATSGTTGTITISPSGLVGGTKYLGSVVYGGVGSPPNPTIIRIDAPSF